VRPSRNIRAATVAVALGAALGLGAPACSSVSKELACESRTECVRGAAQGECMPPGFCAFADGTCPSGLRWDSTAADELAGSCFEDADGADAGAGIDSGGVVNTCGGTTPLAGAPGAPCGICDSGTFQCAGPEAVVCQGEFTLDAPITNLGTVDAETTFSGSFSASLAVDGDLSSSWFSTGPDGDSSPTFYRWDRGMDECISRITFAGNGAHSNSSFRSGFGFGQVTVRVLDGAGAPVFSMVHDLDANPGVPDPSLNIDTAGVVGQAVELLLSGHEDAGCGGFSELTVTAKQ
jgi:hypothetical protein